MPNALRADDVMRAVWGVAAAAAAAAIVVAQILWVSAVHVRLGTPLRPFSGEPIVGERFVPRLRLVDDRDRAFDLDVVRVRGRPAVFYFGYTHCTDACPLALARLARAQRELHRLSVYFVTVDPARDYPAVLRHYLAQFSSRIVGLTGTSQQVKAAERAFGVAASTKPAAIDHDDAAILTDVRGRLVLRYHGADLDVRAFVDDVRRL